MAHRQKFSVCHVCLCCFTACSESKTQTCPDFLFLMSKSVQCEMQHMRLANPVVRHGAGASDLLLTAFSRTPSFNIDETLPCLKLGALVLFCLLFLFPTSLCGVLVFDSASRLSSRPPVVPPPAQLTHTQLAHTQLAPAQLAHTQLAHTQLAHNTACSHTTCSHATCSHRTCTHTHTTCSHTTCSHTTCTHSLLTHNLLTHNLLTQNLHTHNLLTHSGRRGTCVAGVALGDM